MTDVTGISKGLALIEQYESDAKFTAEHDQIWCGQGNGKSVIEITEEGKAIMESMGWFIDVAMGCWSRHV
jgi:23S rRNA A1618 N6-methylase RlmF